MNSLKPELLSANLRQSLPNSENVALRRLSNGILLAARENFTTPAVIVRGNIKAGSQDEMPQKNGLASLTASLLSRGTKRRDYDTINETIESVGASVGFSGGTHTTSAWGKSLAEDFSTIITLISEILRYPSFPEEHVERRRLQKVTSLREQQNNTHAMADLLFYKNAYPSFHPYHYDSSGSPESIEALTRDDLLSFHQANYTPEGAIFVVVGAIPQEEALDLLAEALGNWPPLGDDRNRAIPTIEPPEKISVFHEIPGKTQSDLYYGLSTIPRKHPDFMPLQLANNIMGVFGMMGRIGKSVRDTQGLAYYAGSSLSSALGQGAWVSTAGVSPDKVSQAVESIRYEWLRMGSELVSEEELNDSKAFMTGSLPLHLETNGGIASSLFNLLYYDLGLDYLLTVKEQINAITREEVQRVSQQYFDPERTVLVVAGSKE